jgi:5-methylcytosine-specific restriction endonuclease McrA
MRYVGNEPRICKKCGQPKTLTEGGRWKCKPCDRAWRVEHYHKNLDHERKRGNERMTRYRHDPIKNERIKATQRKCYQKNGRIRQQKRLAKLKIADPWKWKTTRLHPSIRGKISKDELKALFDKQGGKCALTGRDLDFWTMELDHIIPRSKGGQNALNNVQWTCEEANQAKKNLTDDDFIKLCKDVIAFRS